MTGWFFRKASFFSYICKLDAHTFVVTENESYVNLVTHIREAERRRSVIRKVCIARLKTLFLMPVKKHNHARGK